VNVRAYKMAAHEAAHAAACVMVCRTVTHVSRTLLDLGEATSTTTAAPSRQPNGTSLEDMAVAIWAGVLLADGLESGDVRALRGLGAHGVNIDLARERALEMSVDPEFRRLVAALRTALWNHTDIYEQDVAAATGGRCGSHGSGASLGVTSLWEGKDRP
jgi:hypothetical protein